VWWRTQSLSNPSLRQSIAVHVQAKINDCQLIATEAMTSFGVDQRGEHHLSRFRAGRR
jgi:hypothetical protein